MPLINQMGLQEWGALLQEGPTPTERRPLSTRVVKSLDEHSHCVTEVCDTILGHTRERFAFKGHLISATLLQGPQFECYVNVFPEGCFHHFTASKQQQLFFFLRRTKWPPQRTGVVCWAPHHSSYLIFYSIF
ncbi:hypothetical protein EYF80_027372 [Liparis tanakae]|uniref:Uncharacterized protein n=1 Tax=Liparis tanakae TaxID=230148 RepID=A0A4Z2H9S8_9TELE|nr:hypothetical protein EYF80_027372 [Liparis tanakae]